jgi:hypothetical protein
MPVPFHSGSTSTKVSRLEEYLGAGDLRGFSLLPHPSFVPPPRSHSLSSSSLAHSVISFPANLSKSDIAAIEAAGAQGPPSTLTLPITTTTPTTPRPSRPESNSRSFPLHLYSHNDTKAKLGFALDLESGPDVRTSRWTPGGDDSTGWSLLRRSALFVLSVVLGWMVCMVLM